VPLSAVNLKLREEHENTLKYINFEFINKICQKYRKNVAEIQKEK